MSHSLALLPMQFCLPLFCRTCWLSKKVGLAKPIWDNEGCQREEDDSSQVGGRGIEEGEGREDDEPKQPTANQQSTNSHPVVNQ